MDTLLSNLTLFGWGCLGAAFPEVARQFALRHQNVGVPVSYWLRSAAFILASGGIVLALPGPLAALTAVYAGAAAPTLVAAGAKRFADSPSSGDEIAAPTPDKDSDGTPKVQVDDFSGEFDKHNYVKIDETYVRYDGWRRFLDAL